jgi:pantothenate kinase
MAEQGDNSSVDLLVKEIYGDSCEELKLDGNLIAASFGKMNKNFTKEDLGTA